MVKFDLSASLSKIQSTSIEIQVEALEEILSAPKGSLSQENLRAVAEAGVLALEHSDSPYPLAERLARFGHLAVDPLSKLLQRNPASEAAVLASLILVSNKEGSGVPLLTAEIERGSGYFVMAAFALSNAGFKQHIPAMIEKLRQAKLTGKKVPTIEDSVAFSLWDALRKATDDVPEDLVKKYESIP